MNEMQLNEWMKWNENAILGNENKWKDWMKLVIREMLNILNQIKQIIWRYFFSVCFTNKVKMG